MDAYSNMGRLLGVQAPPKWERSDPRKPDWPRVALGSTGEFLRFLEGVRSPNHSLRQRCRAIVTNTPMESIADVWETFIDGAAARFRDASREWERDFLSLRDAWEEIPQQPPAETVGGERAKANSIRYQIRANCDITVIEFFSDAGFLPRYGFPIHLQRLSVRKPREDQPISPLPQKGIGSKDNRSSRCRSVCRGRRSWWEEKSPNRREFSNTGRKPIRTRRWASITGR